MSLSCPVAVSLIGRDALSFFLPSSIIRAKDDTVWMRMKEKGNKGAGRTGPDDGIGGEWSRVQGRREQQLGGTGRFPIPRSTSQIGDIFVQVI